MMDTIEPITDKTVAYYGGLIAVAVVFAYSLVILVYVIVYSSILIYSVMLTDIRGFLLVASGFSVAYSVSIFSLIMAMLSSIVGFFVALVLKKILLYFNPVHDFRKAFIITCVTALATILLIYILLRTLLKDWMTFNYIEPFLFWFLFPSILFFVVCVIGGMRLNKFSHASATGTNNKSTIMTT